MPKAVILLSGGMDSTTALAQASADGNLVVAAVSCFYGSKHNVVENAAAEAVCAYYNVPLRTLVLPNIFSGAGSALMDESTMPHMTYQQIAEAEGPSPTVVPFRNANLLSLATTIAVTHDADYVYAGMHAEDARNWAYPDCTPEFLGAMANAIYVGTYNKVRLMFPFIWMTKAEIVTRAALLEAPLWLTYSCYEGKAFHCGKCPTCVERLEAFNKAGYIDPVKYMDEVKQSGEIFPGSM